MPIEDQISLLKGATFELCQLRFNTVFNAETGTWECGRLSYCLEDPAGARELPFLPGSGRERKLGREERSLANPRMCLSRGCGAEAWVMGRKSLMREVWVLGPLPDKFAPHPAPLLPRFPHPLPDTHPGGFQQLLLEPVLKFHYMLKKLQLHKEEYVLMQAISLFSPGEDPPGRPGLPTPRLTAPQL